MLLQKAPDFELDLPGFLLRGKLFHFQAIIRWKEKPTGPAPKWQDSLWQYAVSITHQRKLSEPAEKVAIYLVKGYGKKYPNTEYSVTEQVFDCWWSVIFPEMRRDSFQSPVNPAVQQELEKYRKQSPATM